MVSTKCSIFIENKTCLGITQLMIIIIFLRAPKQFCNSSIFVFQFDILRQLIEFLINIYSFLHKLIFLKYHIEIHQTRYTDQSTNANCQLHLLDDKGLVFVDDVYRYCASA